MTRRPTYGDPPVLSPIAEALRDALGEAGVHATPRQLRISADALLDHLADRHVDIVHESSRDPRR